MRNGIRNIWLWGKSDLSVDLINVIFCHISESSEGKICIAHGGLRRILEGAIRE